MEILNDTILSLKVFNIYRLMNSSNFHKKTNNLANIKAKQRRMLSFKQWKMNPQKYSITYSSWLPCDHILWKKKWNMLKGIGTITVIKFVEGVNLSCIE